MDAASRAGPDEQAGLGLAQRPAGVGFEPVVVAAQRAQVACDGAPALAVGNGVVKVAAARGLAASRKAADPVSGPDGQIEQPAGTVGD